MGLEQRKELENNLANMDTQLLCYLLQMLTPIAPEFDSNNRLNLSQLDDGTLSSLWEYAQAYVSTTTQPVEGDLALQADNEAPEPAETRFPKRRLSGSFPIEEPEEASLECKRRRMPAEVEEPTDPAALLDYWQMPPLEGDDLCADGLEPFTGVDPTTVLPLIGLDEDPVDCDDSCGDAVNSAVPPDEGTEYKETGFLDEKKEGTTTTKTNSLDNRNKKDSHQNCNSSNRKGYWSKTLGVRPRGLSKEIRWQLELD